MVRVEQPAKWTLFPDLVIPPHQSLDCFFKTRASTTFKEGPEVWISQIQIASKAPLQLPALLDPTTSPRL